MTTTLSIRISQSKKRQVEQFATPNVSAWINGLIDRELRSTGVNWEDHFERLRHSGRVVRGHPDDDIRKASR
jgi:hypothetical protein